MFCIREGKMHAKTVELQVLVALFYILITVVPCGGHKLSTDSVSSLLELAGFGPSCVSRALAQCHEDSNPQALQQSPLFALAIHNMTLDIRQLSSSVQELQSTTEALPLQALLHALQNLTKSSSQALTPNPESSRPRHCLDLKEAGDSGRGVRRIYPLPCCPNWFLQVFCDQETDDGGWTVFQRRNDLPPYEDFYRTWIEYEKGFGDLEGEHWLGLENIHHLTSHSLQELRIDLADFDNATRWAKYGFFNVKDSDSKYVMNCGRYTGDAGDSLLSHSGFKFSTHDNDNDVHSGNCAVRYTGDAGDSFSYQCGIRFSTHDNDNDEYLKNCAIIYKGAWWYKSCHWSNLNGKYLKGPIESDSDGVSWHDFRGQRYSLRKVEMEIRPSASMGT
ncbi:microfibril-associated glycoprotein 4-like [Oratosquilla oratoria]|uniref:microfibril-associated glycoprotein 4-like n=1 Tax=Oratosquilla oratoria TaxID=337810 RepID=UPI003F76B25D